MPMIGRGWVRVRTEFTVVSFQFQQVIRNSSYQWLSRILVVFNFLCKSKSSFDDRSTWLHWWSSGWRPYAILPWKVPSRPSWWLLQWWTVWNFTQARFRSILHSLACQRPSVRPDPPVSQTVVRSHMWLATGRTATYPSRWPLQKNQGNLTTNSAS